MLSGKIISLLRRRGGAARREEIYEELTPPNDVHSVRSINTALKRLEERGIVEIYGGYVVLRKTAKGDV